MVLPSTSDVSRVTLAAFLRPAGSARPIRSSLSRKNLPPFLDFALEKERNEISSQFKRVNSLVLDEMGIGGNAKMTGA